MSKLEDPVRETPAAVSGTAQHRDVAPGKRSRTQSVGAQPRHHVMTGIDLIDTGTACDAEPEQENERCFLAPGERHYAVNLVSFALSTMLTSIQTALGNVKLWKATQSDHLWNGLLEILFLSATGPLIGPIAGALAAKIGASAGAAAELGLTRTAWTLAGAADQKKLIGAVTIGFKGIRGQLAHADGRPKDLNSQMQFLSHLQAAAGPASRQMMENVASMTDAEIVAFYGALSDPEVTNVPAYERRISELLVQFDENRIEQLGNQIFGTREVALVKRVKLRNREYVVLLESFGINHLALELNGAPKGTTMDSLRFVRLVERNLQHLAIEETKARRGEEAVEYIDFNQRGNRATHAWFNDMYRAIKSHSAPDEIGATMADDPFDFGALTRPVGDDDAN
jgi:hypothetical protein